MLDFINPTTRPVALWPNDDLSCVAQPVEEFDNDLEQLIMDMRKTVKTQNGIGLAAPQVGVNQRVFLLDFTTIESEQNIDTFIFINPIIVETSEQMFKWKEGCLSVPGHFETRERPQTVRIKYQDFKGDESEVILRDLVAFAALHEYDHLEGKVFVDGSSSFKTKRIQQKMQKTIKTMRNTNGNYY